MRTPIRRLLVGAACLALLPACDNPTPEQTQNCRIVEHSPSNEFGIRYTLTNPSPCPAPLSRVGEIKTAAAQIEDTGNPDFGFSEVSVYNSAGQPQAASIDRFVVSYGTPISEPRVQYPAGTGVSFLQQPIQSGAYDQGYFEVFNSGQLGAAGNPYGRVEISYRNSPVNASVSGNDVPPPNTSQTWQAVVSGGAGSYTYRWYRDGVAVGTAPSYTTTVGSSRFDLRVEVSDPMEASAAAVMAVDVGGVRVAISGPSTVYGVMGGGTWSATGRGGTLPYTYEWFVDDVSLGVGGTTLSEFYPGEGRHQVRVEMRDALGAVHSATMAVLGIDGYMCNGVPSKTECP